MRRPWRCRRGWIAMRESLSISRWMRLRLWMLGVRVLLRWSAWRRRRRCPVGDHRFGEWVAVDIDYGDQGFSTMIHRCRDCDLIVTTAGDTLTVDRPRVICP